MPARRRWRTALQKLKPSIDPSDAFAWVGLALLSYGASLVYFPAGFLVAGLVLLIAGVVGR